MALTLALAAKIWDTGALGTSRFGQQWLAQLGHIGHSWAQLGHIGQGNLPTFVVVVVVAVVDLAFFRVLFACCSLEFGCLHSSFSVVVSVAF